MTKPHQAIWEDGYTTGQRGKRAECKRRDEFEARVWRQGYKHGINARVRALGWVAV